MSHIHLPKSWGLSVGKEPRKPHCSNFLFPPTPRFGDLQVLPFGRRNLRAWSPSLVTLSQSSAAMGSPWGIFGSHLAFEVVEGDTTTGVSSGCSLFFRCVGTQSLVLSSQQPLTQQTRQIPDENPFVLLHICQT